MSDLILIDGDEVKFVPAFGAAIVTVQAGTLKASGGASLGGKKLCIDGDEKKVSVPNCSYVAPPYSIPGAGTLKITALAPDQKAKKTKSAGKPVLLKGNKFTAEFQVTRKAQQPPPGPGPPTPDVTPKYSGFGMFKTTNQKLNGA